MNRVCVVFKMSAVGLVCCYGRNYTPMTIMVLLRIGFFALCLFAPIAVFASGPAWEECPYRVRIYVMGEYRPPREFARTVRERCAVHWEAYWTVQVEEPAAELREWLRTDFADSEEKPEDWAKLDKIFVAESTSETLKLREFDTATKRLGEKRSFPLGDESKFVDVLVQGLYEVFSPLGRVEQSGAEHVTLLLRGKNLQPPTVSIRTDIFLPFLRTLDRSAGLTQVDRIPWTVLVAEPEESEFLGLRCRVESGVHAPLGVRRRGRTEIYALAVPTPHTPTLLRFVARSATNIGTLPGYSVYEKIPGEKTAALIGKTEIDGTFLLKPDAERSVRMLLIRDGTTLIARFPIVRGLESVTRVPVPDDVVRLEAEAALLGIQEEMIDQMARRDILNLRAKKFEEQDETQRLRDVRSELLRMKDATRYHLELNILRERLRSEDPIVERRINRLFSDTRKMIGTFLQ